MWQNCSNVCFGVACNESWESMAHTVWATLAFRGSHLYYMTESFSRAIQMTKWMWSTQQRLPGLSVEVLHLNLLLSNQMKSFIGTTNMMPVRSSGETGGVEHHRLQMRERVGQLGKNICLAKSPVNCLAEDRIGLSSSVFVAESCRSQWEMLHSTLCYLSVQQLTAHCLSLRQALLSLWWTAGHQPMLRMIRSDKWNSVAFSCSQC